jgi:hypothetical protein
VEGTTAIQGFVRPEDMSTMVIGYLEKRIQNSMAQGRSTKIVSSLKLNPEP